MRNLIILSAFLISCTAWSQKETRLRLDAEGIDKVMISSDEIFKINVSTGAGGEIAVKTRSEGEYFNRITLDSRVANNTLFLESKYPEILESGYDKLSAHKVFSMEIELILPPGRKLVINSNLASVYLTGDFDSVLVQLNTGSCYLSQFSGDAVVNTFNGNIDIGTRVPDARIEAASRHGTVDIPVSSDGKNKIVLNSINGNIKVHKIK